MANIPPQKMPIQMLYNTKSIICTYLTVVLMKGVPVEPTEQSEGVQLANYFLPVEPNPPTRSTSVLPESATKYFVNMPCAILSPALIS